MKGKKKKERKKRRKKKQKKEKKTRWMYSKAVEAVKQPPNIVFCS
jgi:predicted fused transcriptional regulator/phosphomethylpyrimidine kinase